MESYGRELHDSTDLHELCLRSQNAEQAEQTKSMRLWGRQLVSPHCWLAVVGLTFEGSWCPSPVRAAFILQRKCMPWKWSPWTNILKMGLVSCLKSQYREQGSRWILGFTSQSAILLAELQTRDRPCLKKWIVFGGQHPRWSSGLRSKECTDIYTER